MRKLLGSFTAAALLLATAACSADPATAQAQFANTVSGVQIAYNAGEAVINSRIAAGKIPAATAAKIQAIEKLDDPIVASLSATSAPTSVSAVLADAGVIVSALPAADQPDAQLALNTAKMLWANYQAKQAAAAPVTSAAPAVSTVAAPVAVTPAAETLPN